MRTPNDLDLAKNCPKIDLILGGHDHVYEDIVVSIYRGIIRFLFYNFKVVHFV